MPAHKAHIQPRPMRVAFLVEEHEHWKPMLDAIFDVCYGHWGGRFFLLVPCENGHVRAAYVPWLEAYDPDIIYSYVDLDDKTVARLHELVYPAFLVKHRFYNQQERDRRAFRPALPLSPLTVLSAAGIVSRGNPLFSSQPVALVDTNLGTEPSPLLQDNFGCYQRSLSPWPPPRDMADYMRTVTFVPEAIRNNPRIVPRAEGETVPTELALLERIASQRNLVGMAQLSASLAPRRELQEMTWSRTVNVIIGESFTDRIVFWNARHYVPVWLHDAIVTLRLSRADVEDPQVFQAIINIIKNRIRIPLGQASHSHFVIRSATSSQSELEGIVERFKSANTFNAYTCETVASVDACVPRREVLGQFAPHVDPASPFNSRDWHELSFSEDTFRPPVILPRHVRDVVGLPMIAKQGQWALDLDIARTVDYSRYQNVQQHWRLPKRLRMAGAFTGGYTLAHNGPIAMPRVSRGLLTLFSGVEGPFPEVKVPNDKYAFSYAICRGKDWWPFADHGQQPSSRGVAVALRPSDKGRYLTALLRLAGGIHRANEIFLSKFWKDQFEALGATPAVTETRRDQVARTLQKRLRAGKIESKDDWDRIAQLVLSEARAVRLDPRYFKYDDLADQFEKFRNSFWKSHDACTPREEWDDDEKRSLAESVKYLCQREILHQGHEWRCRECYTNNWLSIDELKNTIICDVCGAKRAAPVADPWHFRLNGFVLEGLREHGLLASMWCLDRFSERAESFFYLEPHELFFSEASADQGKPDAELDLVVVSDGVVRLCEAKSSNRAIDIPKLADLALRLRPDIVTLAVMETRSNALEQRLGELQNLLKGSNIAGELITLEPNDIEDSPTLPTGTSMQVRL